MREKRLYGLFFKVQSGRKQGQWVRIFPRRAYLKSSAVRIWQSILLQLSFTGKIPALRPVKA